ncbi:MAG TPA: tryptophan 7-halogenase [Caulobacteraceae bacterium]|nr:tryptophan 7-halogenase [Caulobacteraceae bacterium]
MSKAPLHVVVVGRDIALWLTAVSLQRALGTTGVSVTAVELPASLHPGDVIRSLPALEALHNRLGINEADLIRATRGSYTLGWNIAPPAPATPFFLAHGGYGTPIDGGEFFHYWAKARHYGLDLDFETFSPTAVAARQGRVLLPDADIEKFGRADYGYHLPAIEYAGFLKGLAHRAGLTSHRSHRVVVERDEVAGAIAAVRLDQGRRIEGDLFVDASGVEAVLIGGGLGRAFEVCAAGSPVDRILVASAPRFASVPVYSEVRIREGGWLELLASQTTSQVRFAYSSIGCSDEEALAAARTAAQLPLQQARVRTVQSGGRSDPWTANCIAVGAAAHQVDPLFDLDLHIVQLGIVHLISLFPAHARFDAERDEYNRVLASNLARLRDLPRAFYGLNPFHAAGFWDAAQRRPMAKSARHKIEAFRARGQIPPMEDETFAPDFWRALLVGLGEMPLTWPPPIDLTPPDALRDALERMLDFIKDKVLEQPTHDAYLQRLAQGELV